MSVSPIVLQPIEGDSTEVEEWLVVQVTEAPVSLVPVTFEEAQRHRDTLKLHEPDETFVLVHESAFPA